MKKILSLILVLLLSFSGIIGSSCAKGKGINNITVQSTYNTLKVMQEGEYVPLGQKIDVLTHKGDTESGQLIITPEKDVDSYVLNVSDLTLQGKENIKFLKENVQVYIQKYIYVAIKTNKNENNNYPTGYIPDMLLQQNKAIEYKENFIKAGMNQGITVDFTIPLETEAGVYKGQFELVCDGVSYNVPISLQVYDIAVDKTYGKTCMVAGAHHTMTGEYDTTKESYVKYYETAMNEYKFMLEHLPNSLDPVLMAETAVHYWDNPNFTSFNIPNTTYASGQFEIANQMQLGAIYEYFWQLAIHSKPDMILFDKAYMYLKHVDEARPEKYGVVADSTKDVYEIEDKVFSDLVEAGYFDEYSTEYKEEFEKSIKGVPVLLTGDSTQVNALGTKVNTYCARIDGINTPAQRQMFETVEQANVDRGGETWFYTCNEPGYPTPSHHIDDTLLSSRTMRWMQKEWGLEGYLYWQTFAYAKWTGSETVIVDPYEDPVRFPNVNGDGYLAYPGKKYGEETFLPSLRLISFRDGQEDLNLLYTFEEMLKEKASFYGLDNSNVSANMFLEEFYAKLYTGAVASDDVVLFEKIKKEVYELIIKHKSETNFYVEKSVLGLTATSNIYLANGYELIVNDEVLTGEVCGNGVKYQVVQNLSNKAELEIVIKKDGKIVEKHDVFVSPKTEKASLTLESVSVSENSVVLLEGEKIKIQIASWGEDKDIIINKPSISLQSDKLGGFRLDRLQSMEFTVTNEGSESISFSTMLKASRSQQLLNSYTVEAGETKRIVINKIDEYSTVFSKLSTANVELSFDNYYKDENGDNVKYPDRYLTIENVYYTYSRG